MIIRIIGSNASVAIDDPRDFKAFSVRIEGPFASPAQEAALLGRVASSQDDDHIWISENALRAWPSLAEESWWQDGLTGMMKAVEKFGWIDRTNGSIRAHIERA